ncbi:MAG: hypothetical protein AAF645_08140 [Myxococcota bacterium]
MKAAPALARAKRAPSMSFTRLSFLHRPGATLTERVFLPIACPWLWLLLGCWAAPVAAQPPLHVGEDGCEEVLDLRGVERLASIELRRPVRMSDSDGSRVRLRCGGADALELVVDEDVRRISTVGTSVAVLSRLVALAIVESLRVREVAPPEVATEEVAPPDAREEEAVEPPSQDSGLPSHDNTREIDVVAFGSFQTFIESPVFLGGGGVAACFRRHRFVLGSSVAFHRGRSSVALGEVQTNLVGGALDLAVALSLRPVVSTLGLGIRVDAVRMAGRGAPPGAQTSSGWNTLAALRVQGSVRWPIRRHALAALTLGASWVVRPVAAGVGDATDVRLRGIGLTLALGIGWRG